MVKTPRTRHATGRRQPVTIDLDASEIAEETPKPAASDGEMSTTHVETRSLDAHARDEHASQPLATEAEPTLLDSDVVFENTGTAKPVDEDAPEPEAATETGTATPAEHEYRAAETDAGTTDHGAEPTPTYGSTGTKDAAPTAPPPARGGGFGRLVAGVVGGVVALLLAAILQFAGVLGVPGGGGGSGNVQSEIDGLRTEVEALKGASGGDSSAQVAELASGLAAVKTDVAALQDALSAGGGGEAAGLQALDARIKQIETAVAALGSGGGAAAGDVAALGERIAATEALVKAAQETATGASDKLGALEQSVAALAARVDAQAQQPKIALAIATAALKAAVDRGAPFLAEIETFAAISPQAPEIAELRGYAEKGVATREALRAETEAAAAAMIAAASPADPDAGFFDRLMDSAESLVAVRPIGDVSGTGVPEIVARIEVALNAGELDKALAEYETLPEPSKAAGADFAARVKARADVERLVDQAIAGAMKA